MGADRDAAVERLRDNTMWPLFQRDGVKGINVVLHLPPGFRGSGPERRQIDMGHGPASKLGSVAVA